MKLFAPTVILALTGQALAAVDAYMTINVQTDSQGTSGSSILTDVPQSAIFKSTKAIQLQSWSYSEEQTLNIGSQSSGAGAGKAVFNPLTIRKNVDGNTPTFFSYLTSGKVVVPTIYLFKPSGSSGSNTNNVPFMTIQFRTAAFKTQNISSSDEGPVETITFDYGALQVSYATQQADGTLSNSPNVQGWSRISNTQEVKSVARPS